MKLTKKTIILEAVLWDGNKLWEWPGWIKEAFLTPLSAKGNIHVCLASISERRSLFLCGKESFNIEIPWGNYLVWDGREISTASREDLEKEFTGFDEGEDEEPLKVKRNFIK